MQTAEGHLWSSTTQILIFSTLAFIGRGPTANDHDIGRGLYIGSRKIVQNGVANPCPPFVMLHFSRSQYDREKCNITKHLHHFKVETMWMVQIIPTQAARASRSGLEHLRCTDSKPLAREVCFIWSSIDPVQPALTLDWNDIKHTTSEAITLISFIEVIKLPYKTHFAKIRCDLTSTLCKGSTRNCN